MARRPTCSTSPAAASRWEEVGRWALRRRGACRRRELWPEAGRREEEEKRQVA